MERPSRLEVLMETAKLVASRGTCSRLQVGALVHREGRILVTGYNGTASHLAHCDHSCDCNPRDTGGDGVRIWNHAAGCRVDSPCTMAAHAERNCIDWAARHGTRLEGAELVTTDTPCSQCASSIINAGITWVVALRPYRDETGATMLTMAGVRLSLYEDVR